MGFFFSEDFLLDGHANMSRDADLLAKAELGQPGARVYSWDGAWISLGMQQSVARDLLDADLVPWVMRPTGGRAVLHGHDVTVGLALPLCLVADRTGQTKMVLSRSVRSVYRFVVTPLVEAMNDCGYEVALAEWTEFSLRGKLGPDCFSHVSPNDVVVGATGQKACGCALRLTRDAVLIQASIPNGPPLVDPGCLFDNPASESAPSWDSKFFADCLRSRLEALFGIPCISPNDCGV